MNQAVGKDMIGELDLLFFLTHSDGRKKELEPGALKNDVLFQATPFVQKNKSHFTKCPRILSLTKFIEDIIYILISS
jgi:hypothetical protein